MTTTTDRVLTLFVILAYLAAMRAMAATGPVGLTLGLLGAWGHGFATSKLL
jgi:hypothetical protein